MPGHTGSERTNLGRGKSRGATARKNLPGARNARNRLATSQDKGNRAKANGAC